MTRLILSMKTLVGVVLFVLIASVVGASLDRKDAYPMPEIVMTNSVSPVQYVTMQDLRGNN